jgi:hypothetical protein
MADDFRAGGAYVDVRPNFTGFQKSIGAELAKSEAEFAKYGERAGRAYSESFDARLRLDPAKIKVDADTAPAAAKIDKTARNRTVKLRVEPEVLKSPVALGALGAAALGPQALGLGLGAVGAGAALGAAAAGVAAFAAVAVPAFTAVTAAQTALTTAQGQYAKALEDKKLAKTAAQVAAAETAMAKAKQAELAATASLTPAERQLGTELTGLQGAWKGLQKAQDPAVARALVPWFATARESLGFLNPLITGSAHAIGQLGTEAENALGAPWWKSFFSTLGTTGEIGIQSFGEAVGHVGDGLAHLFKTFAPDIDKIPPLVDKAAGAFDKWGSSVKRSGLDAFLSRTFSHANVATLKTDLGDLGSTLGNVAKATSQLSPAAFLGLSKVLSILGGLSPGQIEAIGALYGVSKLTGGLPGTLLAKGASALLGPIVSPLLGKIGSGVSTAVGKALGAIGLKGLAGKILGTGDGPAISEAAATAAGATETGAAEVVTAITGLGVDVDAALTALGAVVEESSGNVVAAIGVSKGVDIVGKVVGKLFGSSQTVNVAVKVGAANWKPLIQSFRGQVEGPVSSWLGGTFPRDVRAGAASANWSAAASAFRRQVQGPVSSWLQNGLSGPARSGGVSAGRAIGAGIGSQRPDVRGAALALLRSVEAVYANAGSLLVGAGETIMGGLLAGLRAGWNDVSGFLHWVSSEIPHHKGPASYDAVLLTPAGELIMKSLETGLSTGFAPVRALLKSTSAEIAAGFAPAGGVLALDGPARLAAAASKAAASVPPLRLPGVGSAASGSPMTLAVTYDGPANGLIREIVTDLRYEISSSGGGDVQRYLGRGKVRT